MSISSVNISFDKVLVSTEPMPQHDKREWRGLDYSPELETLHKKLEEAFAAANTKPKTRLREIDGVLYPHRIEGATEKEFFELTATFNKILNPLGLRIFGSELNADRFSYDVDVLQPK